MQFIVKEKGYEYEFLLSPGVFVVGRDETCDLPVKSNSVSRRHMSCVVRGDQVTVKDLGSSNGVKVNGHRVQEVELKNGDEVRLGDISLVLEVPDKPAVAGAAASGSETSGEGAGVQETAAEDEEITPAEGSLVKVDPARAHAGVYERDGHWYVADPSTGREVEIAPVERPETHDGGQSGKSLLATKRGRMLIAGGAVVVLLLFSLLLLVNGNAEPENDRIPEGEFDNLIAQTLDVLEEDEVGKARERANYIRNARPDSGAAQSLYELVELWVRLDGNFSDYWVDVKRQLDDLLYNHESNEVRRFVRIQKAFLDDAALDFEVVEDAAAALERGSYEEAYETFTDIGEDRPARRENVDLLEEIKSSWRRHLEDRLEDAVDRNSWGVAKETAERLMEVFPETAENLEEDYQRYSTHARHTEMLETARKHIDEAEYDRAVRQLKNIPEQSIVREDAERMIQEAERLSVEDEKLETVNRAESLFVEGDPDEALSLLDGLDIAASRRLQQRIDRVTEAYQGAREAEENNDYDAAEEYWQQIVNLERRHEEESAYLRRAENELREMPRKRVQYANELIKKADQKYSEGKYKESRETFQKAADLEVERDLSDLEDGLRRLRNRGVREYHWALNETDPEVAIERLRKAMGMLSSDDEYYGRARDRLNELQSEIE